MTAPFLAPHIVTTRAPAVPSVAFSGPLGSVVYFAGGGITPIELTSVPWVYPESFGAIGDGIHDDTGPILAALNASAWVVFRKATYRHTAPITGPDLRTLSAPFGVATLKPDPGVVAGIRPLSWTIDGVWVDGSNAPGIIGLDLGNAGIISAFKASNMQLKNCVGAGAAGIRMGQLVTGQFYDVMALGCQDGLVSQGVAGTPTNSLFVNCQFRESINKGVRIVNGYSINFLKCLFEANFEEGFYMQNVGDNAVEIDLTKCWFEANWRSQASGVNRHAKYHFFCDGANGPGGTMRPRLRDCKFSEDLNEARAIRLANATGFVVDNCKHANEAGQVLVEGTSFGSFPSWQPQNGPFLTRVTDTTGGGAWNSRSHLEDNIEAGWTPWVPVVAAGGAMTIAALVINKARYKIVGKTLYVKFSASFTTGGVANTTVLVPLPANVRSLDAADYNLAWLVDNAVNVMGFARADGANPTSSLQFGRIDGAAWTLGAGRQIAFSGSFELF